MKLSEVSWTDARDADVDLAALPVGSTEQHGPHAPLGTDTVLAEAITSAGADTYKGDVIVAPTVPVGIAEEHRAFAGTLWVSPDVFRAYIRETVESLADGGFDRVVVVNGHGGNVGALREVCARLTRDDIAYAIPFTWFEAVDPPQPMGHGGALETALVRHAHPELVREECIEAAREGAADRWGEWVGGTNLAYDSDEFTTNGVVGDPAAGDMTLGEEVFVEAAAALADLFEVVAERDRP